MTPEPSVRPGRAGYLDPKYLFFGLVALAALFVLYHNERFIIDHTDPSWTYYFPVRQLLIPHGFAGLMALCLGASQFSTRLRQRHTVVHRTLGRLYVAGVAIAAPMGVYITIRHNALPTRIAVITTAFLWFLTTAVAFYCIRRRNFQQHRQWMIRSYAITLTFLVVRVIDAVPALNDLDGDTSPNMLWLTNVIAWVVPSFIIAWPGLFPSPRASRAPVSSSHQGQPALN
ncbi:MAG TPA: DUF2306 domain-containing protein [Steroidobacteraceae bacterium]|nr:DUF2306 domain-containing protein [Steroidobacteraceae bacterium]